jgi:hypothetical protein
MIRLANILNNTKIGDILKEKFFDALSVILAEEEILKKMGVEYYAEWELKEISKRNSWNKDGLTEASSIGRLIEYCGVPLKKPKKATIDDIFQAIKDNEGIIVAINSDKLKETCDTDVGTLLLVVGKDNKNKENFLILKDITKKTSITIPMNLFLESWKDFDNLLLITNYNSNDPDEGIVG